MKTRGTTRVTTSNVIWLEGYKIWAPPMVKQRVVSVSVLKAKLLLIRYPYSDISFQEQNYQNRLHQNDTKSYIEKDFFFSFEKRKFLLIMNSDFFS